MRMKTKILAAAFGAVFTFVATSAVAGTLDEVKKRGFLQCGVSQGLAGFSLPDEKGTWSGFDVDFCRAIAAAVFNDATKVKYTPLSAKERFTALQSGEIDVLSRNTTWTMSRDTALGLRFAGTTYYDGQGFMVRKSLNVTSALQLSGATVCTQTGTTTEQNLADYFRTKNMKYELVSFDKVDDVKKAYETGRCDVFTTDQSGLYAERLVMANPDDNVVLPEIISKEPLAIVVRQGDDPWFNVVRWVYFAVLNAEELGVTSKNVDDMLKSPNPEIARLLGTQDKYGESVGLTNAWAYQIVKIVGNYGEIFERNLGTSTRLKIARGINALWTNGGLQYGVPIR